MVALHPVPEIPPVDRLREVDVEAFQVNLVLKPAKRLRIDRALDAVALAPGNRIAFVADDLRERRLKRPPHQASFFGFFFAFGAASGCGSAAGASVLNSTPSASRTAFCPVNSCQRFTITSQ